LTKLNRYLVFTKNNARWHHAPVDQIPVFIPGAKVIKNPITGKGSNIAKLQARKVPMEYWKIVDGEVVSMDGRERSRRQRHIQRYGADNAVVLEHGKSRWRFVDWRSIISFLVGAASGAVGVYLWLG